MARIKIDEDLPTEIAATLRSLGHDAHTVVEQGLTGTPDDQLWPRIQAECRILFTADKGFADLRSHPPGAHEGVVLFRLPRESRSGYMNLVTIFLSAHDVNSARGAIVVVSPSSIRIHSDRAMG